jgi:hypothetical protein
MTDDRKLRSEHGFVMVPVIILMVVALGVCMALLAIVDTQSGESREQRSSDAAQTLAEGAVSATANVLAANQSLWPTSGACQTASGDLTTAASGSTLDALVAAEIKSRFNGTSPDYANSGTHTTTWRVDVCPVDASDTSRWEESMMARTSVTPVSSSDPPSVWVRGRASVRASTTATQPENTRVVVSKIRQSSRTFAPPQDYAVGTGVFSTDLGTTLSTTLTSNTSLLGGIVKPIVADQTSKIGVRCGLLSTVQNPATTCLAGTLAGVGSVTNATGLGTLNTVLGLRNEALTTWTMAPDDAIETWRAQAKAAGTWAATVTGYGNDITKTVSGTSGSAQDCFHGATTSDTVIFIDKVGNGEQYCNVPAASAAKIIVVERGAIRVKDGTFTGVVYALNKQECTQSDGTCSANDRKNAVSREVVRIDGNAGKVKGSVWADGAGGAVGIYPSLTPSGVSSASLLSLGDATTGICGLPGVGTALTTLNTTLTGVGALLGNTLALLGGVQEQVRYPNGAPTASGCGLLQTKLGTLTSSQLLTLFAEPSTQPIVVSEHRTRNCLVLCGAWSEWSTKETYNAPLQALLTGASPNVAAQLGGLLGATLNNYTAIQYDSATVSNASAHINQGAAPIVGTYRNVGGSV